MLGYTELLLDQVYGPLSERCLQASADAYLPKPASAHTLVATIAQLLGEWA